MNSAPLKVGDTTPWPADVPFDRAKIRLAKSMRGRCAKIAGCTSSNAIIGHARLTIAENATRAALAAEPVERAMTYLRKRGYQPVYNRTIVLGSLHRGYQVGRVELANHAELLASARERGWTE